MKVNKTLSLIAALASTLLLTACGGGGGSSAPVVHYPYETVFGDVCATFEAEPGCTFSTVDGSRIQVSEDPDYNLFGNGSDDLFFVVFDGFGVGAVYNDLGDFQYFADVSDFAGWVGGTQIGVGTTGLFWEDVTGGTYWLGKNGVLYNANVGEVNFGEAINNDTASDAADTNLAALTSEGNKALVDAAAKKLVAKYGFKAGKAKAVASSLNRWGIETVERGKTTAADMDKTFEAVFGTKYSSALAAVKDYLKGDKTAANDLVNRSSAAMGLKPHQTKAFLTDIYGDAAASLGYNLSEMDW